MNNDKSQNKLIIAAAMACFILIAGGVGYRMLFAYYAKGDNIDPLPPGTLATFPMQIGDWNGKDKPLDVRIIEQTDTDDRINRHYYKAGSPSEVWFYVAYGVQARDMMPHRPEVCWTSSGWAIADRKTVKFSLEDGMALDCDIFVFERSGFNSQKYILVNYYLVDGMFAPDVSLLRSKVRGGSGAIKYVAQVEIGVSVDALSTVETAEKILREFTILTGKKVYDLFEDNVKTTPQQSDPQKTGE